MDKDDDDDDGGWGDDDDYSSPATFQKGNQPTTANSGEWSRVSTTKPSRCPRNGTFPIFPRLLGGSLWILRVRNAATLFQRRTTYICRVES
jgi:hypothetical protein